MREAPVTARPWSGYCAINSKQHTATYPLPLYFSISVFLCFCISAILYFFLCISVFLPWSGYCAINSEQHAGTMAHILLLLLPLYFVFFHCLVVSLKADQGNYR